MNYDTLQVILKDTVACITLNRPERLNSFDMQLGHELYEALSNVAQNHEVHACRQGQITFPAGFDPSDPSLCH
jgi:enoyl-CoA hydratase/carnithine racemase